MNKAILDSRFFKRSFLIILSVIAFSVAQSAITVIAPLPSNLTKCESDSLILSISVTSDSMLDFVWKRNGAVIGSNSPILILPSLVVTDSGTYTCEIKEQGTGATNIQTSRVVVNKKPVIVTQPTGSVSPLCEGNDLNLNADIQNATMVWRRDGTILSTGSMTYSKMNITAADSGIYTVLGKAAIGCKDIVSDSFILDVRRHGVITNSLPTRVKLRHDAGMSYVFRVNVEGSGPFAYQWYRNGSPLPGANTDSFKIYNFNSAIDSGVYQVIVNTTLPCKDTLRSNRAPLLPTLCPLIISQTDTVIEACLGGSAAIEIDAVGVFRYQWFRTFGAGGTPDSLEGAIYNRFVIANLDSSSKGFYNVILYQDTALAEDCSENDVFKRVEIRVNPRQKVTVQPLPNAMCDATTHTMMVRASNATGYQWYKNDSMIMGATDSNYTIAAVGTSPDVYKVHVKNPYCTDEPSDEVIVRQMDPRTQVKLATSDKLDLLEQCTSTDGWTYYADKGNKQELLFAIKKNGNNLVFSPDIRFTNGFIKELEPTSTDKKVILMGLRMFTIKLADTASTNSVKNAYSVKFFYNGGPSEKGLFLSAVQARRNVLIGSNEFDSELPLDELSFLTSTHNYMTKDLILGESTAPISFPYNIVNDHSFGTENAINFVEINNLVSSKGGGTFYFHFFKRASSGINNSINDGIVSLYPNPSAGTVNLRMNEMSKTDVEVTVFNLIGMKVKSIIVDKASNLKELDCSDLPNGNYVFHIDNGDQQLNKKVTISK